MTQAIRMLLAEGIISREQFETATLHQAKNGGTLGGFLVSEGIVDDDELVRFLARRFPLPHWPRRRLAGVSPILIGLLSPKVARSLRVLPLMKDAGRIVLGVTDPTAGHALKEAARHMGAEVKPVIISERDMTWALDTYYGGLKNNSEEPAPILLTVRKTRKTSPLRPVSDSPPRCRGQEHRGRPAGHPAGEQDPAEAQAGSRDHAADVHQAAAADEDGDRSLEGDQGRRGGSPHKERGPRPTTPGAGPPSR